MAKQTEAQKMAIRKYRKNKVKFLKLQYTAVEYDMIVSYCNHIKSPIATFIKKLIRAAIDSDPTFVYAPEEDK